jgi:glycosyltransferase involved in cell wall biosynthesis
MALAAMAAAKPVLGWASADLEEIVEDKVTGLLVPYGDRAALAAAVRAVLTNPAYARRLGEAGRARAAGRFGLPRMVDQYTRLYQEIVGDGRAR